MRTKFLSAVFCLILVLPVAAKAKTVVEELKRIKAQIERERGELESKVREQNKILGELELIEKRARLYSQKIMELKKQQVLIQGRIRSLEQEIQKLKARLEAQKQLLARRLRARYEMGEVGTLEVLFSSEQISDLVLRDEYLGRVYEQDQSLIDQYEQGLSELGRRKKELSEKQVELEANLEAAKWALEQLEVMKQNKKDLLERVKLEKQSHLSALSELEDAQRELEEQLKKIEDQNRPLAARPETAAQPPLTRFCLPTLGRVEEKFGQLTDPKFGTKTMHKGIDLSADFGQLVRAVHGGQVVFADWFRGYGNLVIIDHNNGYYSLYAHLDRMDKAAGEPVKKGQVIGSVGDTGSLKGPFLYFELRHHTEAIDPEKYLDSSCVLAGVQP